MSPVGNTFQLVSAAAHISLSANQDQGIFDKCAALIYLFQRPLLCVFGMLDKSLTLWNY